MSKNRKPRQRKQNRRRRNGNRRKSARPPSRPQAAGSFSRLFATGVRSLVSCLPGSKALLPVTDFVMKAIGLTMNKPTPEGVFTGVQNTALGSKFTLSYTNILAGTKAVVNRGRTTPEQGNRQIFCLPFMDARLIEVVISTSPVNVVGKRSGDWTIAFYPFYSAQDEDNFRSDKLIPDRTGIERAPLIATGSASQPLSLRFSPRVTDGEIAKFHQIADNFGGLCIRYNDMNRSSYGEFNGEDFAMDCIIKGRVELRSIQPDALDGKSYTDLVDDVLAEVTHQITHIPTGNVYLVAADHVSEENKASNITGRNSIAVTLEGMSLS